MTTRPCGTFSFGRGPNASSDAPLNSISTRMAREIHFIGRSNQGLPRSHEEHEAPLRGSILFARHYDARENFRPAARHDRAKLVVVFIFPGGNPAARDLQLDLWLIE